MVGISAINHGVNTCKNEGLAFSTCDGFFFQFQVMNKLTKKFDYFNCAINRD